MPTPSHMHFGQFKEAIDRNGLSRRRAILGRHDRGLPAGNRRSSTLPAAAICSSTRCRWRSCATRTSARLRNSEGDDPDKLVTLYIDVLNRAIADRPADLTIGMHLCRGNMEGLWMGDGGYAPIAEALFNRCDVDAFLLEYDSPRAGDFAPLRHLPAGKRAYLGIVSTKNPEIESVDASDAPHRGGAEICADGPAWHLPAMRIFQRGDVEIRDSAEQGYDRHPDAEDQAAGRSRPTRVGARLKHSRAPGARAESYGLFTAAAVQDPYPYYREHARARSGALVGDRAGLVLHPLSTMSSNCRTDQT